MAAPHTILGSGPAGRNIASQLADAGQSVTIISRNEPSGLPAGVQHLPCDLQDRAATADALAGAQTLYHCAAPAYHQWAEEFPALQTTIVDAAATVGAKLVVLDNAYGYGINGTLNEETPMQARGKKGALRAQMADTLLTRHKAGDVQVAIARACDFVGPGVRVSALGDRFWPVLLAGKKPSFLGDPDQPHSYTNVEDLAKAMILLGTADVATVATTFGRAWHVPNAQAVSANQILQLVSSQTSLPPQTLSVMPRYMQGLLGFFVPALKELLEVRYQFEAPFILDSSAFQTRFGVSPTPIDATIANTLAWWRAQTAYRPPKDRTQDRIPDDDDDDTHPNQPPPR